MLAVDGTQFGSPQLRICFAMQNNPAWYERSWNRGKLLVVGLQHFIFIIFDWRSTFNWIMCLLRIIHYLCCGFKNPKKKQKKQNSWISPTFDRHHERRWQWKWTVIVRWFVYAGNNNIVLYSRFTDRFVVVVDIELILSMEFIFWFAYFQSLQLLNSTQ